MINTRIISAACMLLFAVGTDGQGAAVAGSGLGAMAGAVDSEPAPTFYRHLMSFDKTVGDVGTGCGGDFQECCADGLCAADSLTCANGERCLKCGTSGRPACDAPGTSPCGEGLVARQGICFKDFKGIKFGGGGGGSAPPPGSYGGKPPVPPPAPAPPPDSGEKPRGCGGPFGACCDDGSCSNDKLACRSENVCLPCGDFGQAQCSTDPPCGDGLTPSLGFCGRETTSPDGARTFVSSSPGGKSSATITRIPRQADAAPAPKSSFELRGFS